MASEERIWQSFREQVVAGELLGSPFTSRLGKLMLARLDRSSAVGRRILSWEGDPGTRRHPADPPRRCLACPGDRRQGR